MVLATRLWAVERPRLDDILVRLGWHADALCRIYPNVDFFVERGEPTAPAKAICARCTLRDDCLEYVLAQGPHLRGVWGGTSRVNVDGSAGSCRRQDGNPWAPRQASQAQWARRRRAPRLAVRSGC
jgi:hypothetical protein